MEKPQIPNDEEFRAKLDAETRFTDLQRKWIEMLFFDGTLRQGKGRLERVNKDGKSENCCLGVCARFIFNIQPINQGTVLSFLGHAAHLPNYENIFLVSAWGNQMEGDGSDALTELNDTGWTFREIATLLLTHPELYFTNFKP